MTCFYNHLTLSVPKNVPPSCLSLVVWKALHPAVTDTGSPALPRSGDADLYVSRTLLKPSFDPEEFDFSSATCGQDSVDIPRA